jgi:hypothetical protein
MMKAITSLVLLCVLSALFGGEPVAGQTEKQSRKPNFTVSKETTHLVGPLDRDGYVDYVAALNERLGKGVTPETNANVLIWKALGPRPQGGKPMPPEFFKLMGMEEPPEKGEYFLELSRYLREHLKIKDDKAIGAADGQLSLTMQYSWAATDYPEIVIWLNANEKPLAVIAEGVKRSDYFSPLATRSGILGAPFPGLSQCRYVSHALAARAMLRTHEGKYDEAWQDLWTCHRLARHIGRGRTFTDVVTALGIENIVRRADLILLGRPGMNDKQIRRCLGDLQALPAMSKWADCMDTGERYEVLEHMMFTDKLGLWYLDELIPRPIGLPKGRLENTNWDGGLRNVNKWFDRTVVALREMDRPARQKELDRIDAEVKNLKSAYSSLTVQEALLDKDINPEARGKVLGDVVLGMFIPSKLKVQLSFDRQEQGDRNLHIAIALAAYQRDHSAYPKTLDALVPKYLAKLPDDLFTGKPLVYRPTDKGYLLYSFGLNGKDEEGQGIDDEPKGDDIAVRVPVPRPAKK